jgi:hypothetical protein
VEEFWTYSVLDNNEIQRHIVVSEEKLDVIGAWMLTSCRNRMLLAPEWTQAPELGCSWHKLQELDLVGTSL